MAKTTKAVKTEAVKVEEPKIIEQEEPKFSKDDVDRIVAEAVANALAQQQPQTIQVSQNTPMVRMRFQAQVSPENQTILGENGKYGTFVGQTWIVNVPHDAFIGDFRNSIVQKLLDDRSLLVVDGLTDEERTMYGVNYYDGEVMEEKAFRNMIQMGDEILRIYPKLCDKHKDAVAVKYITEFETNKNCISRKLAVELNKLSKNRYPVGDARRKSGDFASVIAEMNASDE